MGGKAKLRFNRPFVWQFVSQPKPLLRRCPVSRTGSKDLIEPISNQRGNVQLQLPHFPPSCLSTGPQHDVVFIGSPTDVPTAATIVTHHHTQLEVKVPVFLIYFIYNQDSRCEVLMATLNRQSWQIASMLIV